MSRFHALVMALAACVGLLITPPVSPDAQAATPGLDRRYFSVAYANLDGDTPWVRKGRYTLTPTSPTAGKVSNAFAHWTATRAKIDQPMAKAIDVAGYVPCHGVQKCLIRKTHAQSTGTWTGTYTFAGSENAGTLTIRWSSGMTEVWSLAQNPSKTLSRMALVRATWKGEDPNRGFGYGSRTPWTVAKTAAEVDAVTTAFPGHRWAVDYKRATPVSDPWALNMPAFARPNGGTTMAYTSLSPKDSCGTAIDGTVVTMAVEENRVVWQNNWRRCLVGKPTGSYEGGMHVHLYDQVIDDRGALVGFVGIEASSSPWDRPMYGFYLGVDDLAYTA